ncbi:MULTISPECIES: AAA family ATPase [unclassified Pseudoalteromonas]|jgi:putative ATP-dependent endonuclease of OLD family|uniref:ATP-dependent nuclease n=3 Tax=Pseudoalteromonas TaxID=53246 RepID=UPI0001EF92B6|nr:MULTISPECIES: AAA family ATPase [unclassified Pseudoalteromonas]ADT68973.1 ATP-dependent endonuclease of the OLD family-like protein [Pseudoalteromonas sp. SM9913]MDN3487440.1 AAA family ATPase [Pseudoalteromonas sp. APC 3224]TMP47863.1 ATP-dependent endonuclease [Pseudoalteromonas sp. S1688]TMS92249.1 ATP-dependent endonuclease [Pseudoalteromonas sp. S201]
MIPKIKKLIIKNFGCIGANEVTVDIDKIVVLVGANNAGKSTILRAFEVVTDCLKLEQDDFHNKQVTPESFPEVEVYSLATDETKPGDEWCLEQDDGMLLVREKWTWNGINVEPVRVGFNVNLGRYAQKGDDETMPWGMNNKAKSKRPKPHRVSTFDDPEIQARAIKSLLKSLLDEGIKQYKENDADEKTVYEKVLDSLDKLRKDTKVTQNQSVQNLEATANEIIGKIFPNHELSILAPESNSTIKVDLLGDEFDVQMGAIGGEKFPLNKQGSGSRRTALWTILKLLADNGIKAKNTTSKSAKSQHEKLGNNTSHVLLLDEPEVSLHPTAIDSARDVLYSLPESDNWQVMIATHSPNFIDLSKDHTTVIRVEKNEHRNIKTTTLYRPEDASLDDDDKENLKLTNLFDSHISQAFFGGRVLVVEGDTEYSAFGYIKDKETSNDNFEYHDLNIVRARGKVTVASMMKVLNHFKGQYFVLHDTDTQKCMSKRRNKEKSKDGCIAYDVFEMNNPAWTNNGKIQAQMQPESKVVASIVNFEEAYFSETVANDKPENCINNIKTDPDMYSKIKQLLDAILEKDGVKLPSGAIAWADINELDVAVTNYQKSVQHIHTED